MTSPTADEVYDQFKTVLRETVDAFDDHDLKCQVENGMADWSLNDQEHVLLEGVTNNTLAKILCHIIILGYAAEERYLSDIEGLAKAALDEIEASDQPDEEKILAADYIETVVTSQTDGFAHCIALIHGYAIAAISADEGETVDWDKAFMERSGEGNDCE